MKILIISSFFPPQNSIASLRPYSWAKYWSAAGHDVTVLTTLKPVREEDLHVSCDGFDLIELQIPGLALLRKAFITSKRETENHHIAPISMLLSSAKRSMKRMYNFVQNAYGAFSGCRMPDWRDPWALIAYLRVRNQRWDLVVSTAGPYSVHYPAYMLRRSGKAQFWVADWRDLWTDNHIFSGIPIFRCFERFIEGVWCQRADILTTVSEPLAEVLRKKYGDKVRVVYNGYEPSDYVNNDSLSFFSADSVFKIVYTGSIYHGKRDPGPLFAAIRALRERRGLTSDVLCVIFAGYNSDVTDIAMRCGVSEFVQYAGFLARDKSISMQRNADVLLFLEYEDDKVQGILTGKIFEYLVAGPVILAVGVGQDSSVGALIRRCERGVALGNDASKIEEWLERQIYGERTVQRDVVVPEAVKLYTRENQALMLLDMVNASQEHT